MSLNGQWENGHFYLAKYYEKIMNSVDDPEIWNAASRVN